MTSRIQKQDCIWRYFKNQFDNSLFKQFPDYKIQKSITQKLTELVENKISLSSLDHKPRAGHKGYKKNKLYTIDLIRSARCLLVNFGNNEHGILEVCKKEGGKDGQGNLNKLVENKYSGQKFVELIENNNSNPCDANTFRLFEKKLEPEKTQKQIEIERELIKHKEKMKILQQFVLGLPVDIEKYINNPEVEDILTSS